MSPERCRYFRSKTMFVGSKHANDTEEEESPVAAFCWCNFTMTEIGKDGCLVGLSACSQPERSCYCER